MKSKIKKEIKGIKYMRLVLMFAQSAGLPFFTTTDQMIARRLYENFAAINN